MFLDNLNLPFNLCNMLACSGLIDNNGGEMILHLLKLDVHDDDTWLKTCAAIKIEYSLK
jgi:hypothetical protein